MTTLNPGQYIIWNPSSKAFLGIAADGLAIQSYDTVEKAQVWDVTQNQICTRPGNLSVKFWANGNGVFEMNINPTGGTAGPWKFDSVGGNMWKISYASNPIWNIITEPLCGSPATGKVIMANNANPGAPGHWSFLSPDKRKLVGSGGTVNSFSVSPEKLQKIAEEMLTAFRENLKQPRPSSMIPTYVRSIPDGTETGSFLGLTMADNLSISHFEFDGVGTIVTRNQRTFSLTLEQLGGEAAKLFEYIARCIAQMVKAWDVDGTPEKPRYLGMTFPYPVQKTAINTGKPLRWTKEVSSSPTSGETVGEDVVELLQQALGNKQLNLNVKCNALINDTTATLLAQAYKSGGCEIAAIFDSGTNVAYVEATENVASLRGKVKQPEMILNTEWGGFTSNDMHRTQFDYRMDRESGYPGKQVFEKLVSAASLGELARLYLLHLIDSDDAKFWVADRPLFNRRSSRKLNAQGAIGAKLLRAIDVARNTAAVQRLLVDNLDLAREDVNEDDVKQVKDVCRAVLRRAARLSACTIAAILVLMGHAKVGGDVELGDKIDIGIAGILTLPAFKLDVQEALGDLIGEKTAKNVSMVTVDMKDTSDIGAALCACLESEDKDDFRDGRDR